MRRALLLGLSLAVGGSASAEDGTLRIRESALNRFAAAVQPLTLSRSMSFTLWIPVPNPFLFGIPTPVPIPFTCNATASVTGLSFDVDPGLASVRGNVTGTVCGVAYQSTLASFVTISLDPARRALVIMTGPMLMIPNVNFLGFTLTAPFAVNVAPALTLPPIPLESAPLEIETPAGPRNLIVSGRNLQLTLQNGFLELKGDAVLR